MQKKKNDEIIGFMQYTMYMIIAVVLATPKIVTIFQRINIDYLGQ